MSDIFSIQTKDFSTSVPHKVTISGCNNYTVGIVSGFEFVYSPIGSTEDREWPENHIVFDLNTGNFVLVALPPRGVLVLTKIITKKELPFDSCNTNGCKITLVPYVGCLALDNQNQPDENQIKYRGLSVNKAYLMSYDISARHGLYLVASAQFMFFELEEEPLPP